MSNETTSILTLLLADLDRITEVEVDRAIMLFEPPAEGEEPLGVIEDPLTRRIWALGLEYQRRAQLAHHAANFDAADKEQRRAMQNDYRRWDALSDLTRELAWLEMRNRIGAKAWEAEGFGLRAGFVLVACKPEQPKAQTFEIPLPAMLAKMLMGRMGSDSEPQNEAPPKKKPQ